MFIFLLLAVIVFVFVLLAFFYVETTWIPRLELKYADWVYISLLILVVLFLYLYSLKSYAAYPDSLATSSDGTIDDFEDEFNNRSLEEKIEMLIDRLDLFLATPSVPEEDVAEEPEHTFSESEIIPYSGETLVRRSRSVSNFRNGYKKYSNMLRFDVSYGGNSAVLFFPVKYENDLLIDNDGFLINVGVDTVTGILLNGNADLNINADLQTQVILNSIMSSNAYHGTRSNGSYSFYRTHYWTRTNGRYLLNTRDYYTKFKVTKTYYLYKTSDTVLLLIMFFCGGGFLLCFLTHLKKY